MLLACGHTEEKDKQKHKRRHHCVAEGGERYRHNLILNQSDQEHRYTVAEGQILDTAFFGKAVDHKEGLKTDHQAATEDLQVNVKAQNIVRQRKKESDCRNECNTRGDSLNPHDNLRQEDHRKDTEYVADRRQQSAVIDVNVDGDLSVESRGGLKEIKDKSHLPKAEHREADEHPKRNISPLFLVFYENRVIHKPHLPLLRKIIAKS